VVVAVAAVRQAMTLGNSSIVDEEGHHRQIDLIREGHWTLHRNLTCPHEWNQSLSVG